MYEIFRNTIVIFMMLVLLYRYSHQTIEVRYVHPRTMNIHPTLYDLPHEEKVILRRCKNDNCELYAFNHM